MQGLIPASVRPVAERNLQQMFSKTASGGMVTALLVVLVIGAHLWLRALPDRAPRAAMLAPVRFEQVALEQSGFAPLKVAGAWRITSAEPRMGGVSAVAVDRGGLLALTDAGVLIRLPKPSSANRLAMFRDLPAGPGSPVSKAGRDSEALTRDSAGRGWWVTFENVQSAFLYDPEIKHALRIVDLWPLHWRANMGAEGAISTANGLLMFPERGHEVVLEANGRAEREPITNPVGRLSDATMLPDSRIVVIARSYSPLGFSARLLLFDRGNLRPLAKLALGRLDNAEAIAAEPLAGGGVRFWLMTDNDFRRRVPTLLVALDWRPSR